MFKLSTNKCYNEWFKSIEQILMSCSSINQKECKIILTFQNDILSYGVAKPY
jgi:hypothetical protein